MSLYRAMLETGGPKDESNEELKNKLRSSVQIGVVYFMMTDQVALADCVLLQSGGIPGWESIENDVSEEALTLIKNRFRELREGLVRLNRESDSEFFEKKAGVRPYALDKSPLVRIFTVPDDEGSSA